MKFYYSINHSRKKIIEAKSYSDAKSKILADNPGAERITITRTDECNHYNYPYRGV